MKIEVSYCVRFAIPHQQDDSNDLMVGKLGELEQLKRDLLPVIESHHRRVGCQRKNVNQIKRAMLNNR
jgi:hypothetical protein